MANLTQALNSIFISKVRIKALKYFSLNPHKAVHMRGAVRIFKEEINAVRRELFRLEEVNILRKESKGNKIYFSLNLKHPYSHDLICLFNRTFGLGGAIVKAADKLGSVSFAILTSHYLYSNQKTETEGVADNKEPAGENLIDLVVIGEIKLDAIQKIVKDAEEKLGREVNYTVFKDNDFLLRKRRRDQFVTELLIDQKLLLVGNITDLSS